MKDYKTKWMYFTRIEIFQRKTQTWQVLSNKLALLGIIKWYSAWRCYAFHPNERTVFNSECLKDIKKCIDKLMRERKKETKNDNSD